MEAPRVPFDEEKRLAAHRKMDILDTPAEERSDRVTRIARRLPNVPITLVSLVDADRQWFKSAQGLDAMETPREVSFRGHAILGEDPFVVEDTVVDERFADNPFVTGDPSIRCYAGIPLSGPSGERVGTLCVIDREPRKLEDHDMAALWDLAAMVESELQVTKLNVTTRTLSERLAAAERKISIDPVTRIWSREAIPAAPGGEFEKARRQRRPISLLLARLDRVDDLVADHGEVMRGIGLRVVADRIRSTLRPYDAVGLAYPVTFLVVLPGPGRDATLQIAGRAEAAGLGQIEFEAP